MGPEKADMPVPPQERILSDALRGGLSIFRVVASMGREVKVTVGSAVLDLKDNTTDTDLDHFIYAVVNSTSGGPAQPEQVMNPWAPGMMVPPFQLDTLPNAIVSANGYRIHLPHRVAAPLKEMLLRDPDNPAKCRHSFLTYEEVAKKYKEGWIEDYYPSLDQKSKDARLRLAAEAIAANPHRLVAYWRGELSELLKDNEVEKGQIFKCWMKMGYQLGTCWHPTKPILSTSGPDLSYRDDLDRYQHSDGKKKRHEHQDEREY